MDFFYLKKTEKFYTRMIFPLTGGIFCVDKNQGSICVLDNSGKKQTKTGLSVKRNFFNIPFLRGIYFFAMSLYFTFYGLFTTSKMEKQTQDFFDKTSKRLNVDKKSVALMSIFVFAFLSGVVALGIVPVLLTKLFLNLKFAPYLRGFLIGIFRVVIFLLLILSLKIIPSVREFLRSQTSINVRLTGEKHSPISTLHFWIFSLSFSLFMISLLGIMVSPWANWILNFLVLAFSFMLCYEILIFAEFTKYTWIRYLFYPTMLCLNVKPSDVQIDMLESLIMEMENFDVQKEEFKMDTKEDGRVAFSVAYVEIKNKLLKAGIEDISEVDWLMATVLNKNRAELKLTKYVSEEDLRKMQNFAKRRIDKEPLSNIFGFSDFYGLRFTINKYVLTPRQETELLVDEALRHIDDKSKVLDIGTGSGAIAIAVKVNRPNAKVTAIDISDKALAVAMNNAEQYKAKINFIKSNLFEDLKKRQKFDIIISNPPYIKTEDVKKLEVEVKNYDPIIALDGGNDGLDFYRQIIQNLDSKLNKNGMVFFEVGKGQAKKVEKMLLEKNFETKIIKDYSKIARIVMGIKKGKT